MSGHIDPALVELKHLFFVSLSQNDFCYNPIPEFLGSLTELKTLDLSHARFEGKIPPQLGNLTKLQHFDLSEDYGDLSVDNLSSLQLLKLNYLNLSKVACIGSLKHLDLEWNDLQQWVPYYLANLENLRELDLFTNKLNGNLSKLHFFGHIPANIGQIMFDLWYFDASNNNITGNIPSSIGNLKGMFALDLSGNELSGNTPPSFSNMAFLNLNDNELFGSSLSSLGALEGLDVLELANNRLSGELPQALKNGSSLTTLDLSYNEFA
ncbi:probable leucine-rich repeat receptor-like protein kinase At1g35710 [Amborella trichopoda]|nr:probable leucine-rich repeat receptor-like protein kinase At1g35710 [Amborella trichopoda]|eukprot:XP_020528281.1 probable leucine-rich repeat receptor-like protein kinase At1g35710 [Amborella trichopoda]